MKALAFIALSLVSSFAFASSPNCNSLVGTYKCEYMSMNFDIDISVDNSDGAFVISVNEEDQKFYLDGKEHKSSVDDSTNVASCSAGPTIDIENTFHSRTTALISIAKLSNGKLSYSIVKDDNTISIVCQ